MKIGPLPVSDSEIARICRQFGIRKLEAFGSVLRSDFSDESDVDLLAEFEPMRPQPLMDLLLAEAELSKAIGRKVDLIPKTQIKWVIRERVLAEAQAVYSA